MFCIKNFAADILRFIIFYLVSGFTLLTDKSKTFQLYEKPNLNQSPLSHFRLALRNLLTLNVHYVINFSLCFTPYQS